MGTWSSEILGNDTSAEVYEEFFLLYNCGEEVEEITKKLLKKLTKNLDDKEEKNNILFSLALAQWETGFLEKKLYNTIKKIIETKDDIMLWKELGAKEETLISREKKLNLFIKRISTPKKKIKKRKKPPIKITTEYTNGTCLAFQYPDLNYGGVVIINSEFYDKKGGMQIAFTKIKQQTLPKFDDFCKSYLLDCEWYDSTDLISNEKIKIAGISNHCLEYFNKKEKKIYFEYLNSFFLIIGKLSEFSDGYHSTTWIEIIKIIEKNPLLENFKNKFSNKLYYYYKEHLKKIKIDNIKLENFSFCTKNK